MPEHTEVLHLIKLLDAESEEVRRKVYTELERRVEEVESLLFSNAASLAPEMLYRLQSLLQSRQYAHLRESWVAWMGLDSPYEQLEDALGFLSHLQRECSVEGELSDALDRLADDYLAEVPTPDPLSLSGFLFEGGRLRGNEEDYYHPCNSNLLHVLATGKGLPISLVCIYMLCGSRLGFSIQGFNYPSHFLAKVILEGQVYLIDCYNGGKVLDAAEIKALSRHPKVNFPKLLKQPPKTPEIVLRVLANLRNAYYRTGSVSQYRIVQELQNDLRYFLHTGAPPDLGPASVTESVVFQPGQIVRHKRYGYRGVVVDCDRFCQADDAWYFSNLTQPERNQPWYHVLVDGSNVITYPAQSNLEEDATGTAVQHPLVGVYFDRFESGQYVRNHTPWQSPG